MTRQQKIEAALKHFLEWAHDEYPEWDLPDDIRIAQIVAEAEEAIGDKEKDNA